MLRRVLVALTVVLLVTTAVSSVPGGLASSPSVPADTDASAPFQTTPDGFTNTAFEIRLYENTSARWTVRHTTPLDNETEIEQFESYARRFENTTTETYTDFTIRAERLVAFGTNGTGRQMRATGFSRDARVEQLGADRGVVELSFLWTNFSRERDGVVVAGDVFQGGMYINRGQRLVMAPGGNLTFDRVDPPPDSLEVEGNLTASETVTWFGGDDGTQFADSRPLAVLTVPDAAGGGTGGTGGTGGDGSSPTATADATETGTPDSPSTGGFGPLAFVLALLLLVGLGGGIAWYSGTLPDIVSGSDDGGAEAAQAETDTPATEGAAPEPAIPEEELLSDEDRVLKLLEDNGGRMKQVNIVEETEWSKSKVSMLLSEMEEAGDISKLRVGRENIISIKGEEPDAVGSPFDDE
ncbi:MULTISPECIES: helix-turn-helix transcriptional regulator [Salinibaculum]|uniref:helix-turn-helix transcriptional regulator n=1 Tax=Salinibaculum TaxID=2732368 RepID=UPI0030D3D7F4